jgi:hypothetical protein
LGKKFTWPHLNQWLNVVVCACYPSYARKHKSQPRLARVSQKGAGGVKSSGRAPASQVWDCEFNPSITNNLSPISRIEYKNRELEKMSEWEREWLNEIFATWRELEMILAVHLSSCSNPCSVTTGCFLSVWTTGQCPDRCW